MRKSLMVLLLIVTLAVGMIGAVNAEQTSSIDHGHGPQHPDYHPPHFPPYHPPFYPPFYQPWHRPLPW